MKRTLCLFLALILAVGICFSAPVTITASAAEAVTSGNCGASTNEGGESSVTWAYDSATTTLTISGTGAMEDYSYDNNPWESYRNEMTNVIISNGVTSIGSFAFYKCTLLASIEIPQSVTTIGSSAFYKCTLLASIEIPQSVTTIGEYAFFGCTALISVIIPNSVITIEKAAFYGCSALETVIIPDSVTTIGEYAFGSCTALVTVKLGKGITTMGGYIFRDCVLLKSVTISEGVTTIGEYAFYGCSALETVIIPDSVTTIGEFAFGNCKGLETIILPDKLTIIGSGAFSGCSSLVSITIPISVTEISGTAFEGCTLLASVNAPCSWNEKPLYKFKSGVAVNIQSHTLENNVCIICSENKCGASESDNVVWFLDDGVLYISGTGAMADYDANNTPWKDYKTQIKKVVVGDGVTSIGNDAFWGCTALTSVIISGSVTRLGDKAFWNCTSLTSVTIPESVTTIGDSAFVDCASLTSINVDENNTAYESIDGVLFNKEKTEIIRCPQNKSGEYSIPESVITIGGSAFSSCEALTSVIIPDSVTTIGRSAFWGCSALNLVEIPKNVTTIGESAFTNCSALTSVIIPDNVTTISTLAFWNCTSLTSVTIPESVTTIGDNAFYYCTSLASVTIPDSVKTISEGAFCDCTALTSVTIPDSVTTIGRYAFQGCTSLASVTIGNKVSTIGASAFSDCSRLTSVTIGKGVTEIDDYAFDGCTKLTTVNVPCNWDGSIYSFAESKLKIAEHNTTKSATCISKAKCSVCGEYGDFAPHTYKNGKCTAEGCGYACAHETITDGVCVACRGRHCGKTENDKIVWFYDVNTTILIISGEGEMADFTDTSMPWYNCIGKITRVVINKGVTSIGESAFAKCTLLEAVKIGEDVTTIGDYAFAYCSFLRSVTMGDSVTSIGDYAFAKCIGLRSVTIPDSVTTISDFAFCGCESLTSVTIPKSVTTIGTCAFDGCAALTSINVDGANTKYLSVDGVLFNKDKTELIYYPLGKTETSYTVPESVTTIGEYAFKDCTALTSVTIGKGVTEIDDYAFSGCENMTLTVVLGSYAHQFAKTNNIPYIFNWYTKEETAQIEKLTFTLNADSESYSVTGCDTQISGELKIPATYNGKPVTEIGNYAFSACTALATVTIPDSVTTIGNYTFNACTALATVTIPDSVTTIGNYTFNDCRALATVTIGKDVTTIGDYAFNGCNKLLTVNVPCDWDTENPPYAFDENVLKKYHNIVIDEAVAATCTKTGLTEGQHCTRCDDKTVAQEVVPALNHKGTLVQVEEEAKTCTTVGWEAYEYCTACDYTTYVEIPASHEIVKVNAKAKTCKEAGHNAHEYCTACDYTTYVEIPASHELQEEKAKAPTCEAIGYDAYEYCTECDYTTYVEKAKLGHDIIIDEAKAATCTETGLTEGSHCTRCDDKTVKQDIIPKKGHTEIKGGTEGAHTICSVCKDVLSAEHEFASKITTEPTYTKEGIKTFTCECGYSYEEVIPCLVPGEIKAEEAESNSFSATVVDINSIVTKLQLTEEEKALIEQGADMKIVFKLSDIGATINTPEKEAIFKALTNEKIALFLDIQLVKQIANNSVNVQKLNDLIKVTVELPSEFISKDGNTKRSYSVLRYHDGDETKVTTLNAKFDETTGTLTFETDRFSTYAIVYSDVVVSNGEGAPGTLDPGDGEVSTPETPKDETTPGTPETPKDETTPVTPETPKDETTPNTPEVPKDDVSSDKTDDSVTNDKNDASSETGTNDKNDTSKDDVPKAGVISTTSIWLGAMALSGLGALLVSKKKKED